MAFHRGTLRALIDVGVLDAVEVVSSVSGGSVFGAAWMCALADGKSNPAFIDGLRPILERGFFWPAIFSPRFAKVLLPGWTRTNRLAETFDELLTQGRKLKDLPAQPDLCMNTTVLNHAAVGRFSREGFSCRSVGKPGVSGSYPTSPLSLTAGFATAASAAFPFALPPLTLAAADLLPFEEPIQGHRRLYLTDGGVLENLGVQLLLRSRSFGTKHIIISDAGTHEQAWRPTLVGRLESFAASALTRETLSRLVLVMHEKQNKSMRQIAMQEVGHVADPDLTRSLWFVRIDQNWRSFIEGISGRRLATIASAGKPLPPEASAAQIVEFLGDHGIDLQRASQRYAAMGGDASAARANEVATQFTGLSAATLDLLELHAAWQVHACHAVYGGIAPAPQA